MPRWNSISSIFVIPFCNYLEKKRSFAQRHEIGQNIATLLLLHCQEWPERTFHLKYHNIFRWKGDNSFNAKSFQRQLLRVKKSWHMTLRCDILILYVEKCTDFPTLPIVPFLWGYRLFTFLLISVPILEDLSTTLTYSNQLNPTKLAIINGSVYNHLLWFANYVQLPASKH